MDIITAYHQITDAIVAVSGASRPMLHVHAGMLIYLGCQLLMGTRRGTPVALGIVLLIALAHEMMNRLFHGSWRPADTSQDLLLTLFWPSVSYSVSRFRRWHFAHRMQSRALAAASRAEQAGGQGDPAWA